MKNRLKLAIGCLILLTISSCGLKPINSEFNFIKIDMEEIDIDKLGNGKILIYNGANIFHKIDNTARLNVWIEEKALGQLGPSKYILINLEKGSYEFRVAHLDMVKMKSSHSVKIDETTKIIKIKPTVTSNKLEVTNELPKNIDKFESIKY